jgi:hypothetical protein
MPRDRSRPWRAVTAALGAAVVGGGADWLYASPDGSTLYAAHGIDAMGPRWGHIRAYALPAPA